MPEIGTEAADPDLLIDFHDVSLLRDGHVLVGPLDWAVELDERWVIVGPNGAGKTSLLRIAAAAEHPSAGVAFVLGERLGRVDVSELRSRIGLSSSALAQRVPTDEVVRDLVVSAGYAVLGRWRRATRRWTTAAPSTCWRASAPSTSRTVATEPCRKASASAC